MPRSPSPVKMIVARLELERLARRPPPVTDQERRWVTAPLARAWTQWQSASVQDAVALRALYVGYSRTFARWQQLQGTRRDVSPGEDPTLYALLPRYPEPCRELRCGARTRRGTPCKRHDLYGSGRCPLHGGLSTGPRTSEGKARSARNGHCPKRTPCEVDKTRHYVPDARQLDEVLAGEARRPHGEVART
jgi:hypothetical protein